MARIWVHIDPTVAGDGDESKKALKGPLKAKLNGMLVAQTAKALPTAKFSTKTADKPKGDGKTYNAIMITPQLKLKVESKGSLMKLGCNLTFVFTAIATPVLKNGNLLGQASSSVQVEDRGSGDQGIEELTAQALDAVVVPLVKKVLSNPRFNSYGKQLNLPL